MIRGRGACAVCLCGGGGDGGAGAAAPALLPIERGKGAHRAAADAGERDAVGEGRAVAEAAQGGDLAEAALEDEVLARGERAGGEAVVLLAEGEDLGEVARGEALAAAGVDDAPADAERRGDVLLAPGVAREADAEVAGERLDERREERALGREGVGDEAREGVDVGRARRVAAARGEEREGGVRERAQEPRDEPGERARDEARGLQERQQRDRLGRDGAGDAVVLGAGLVLVGEGEPQGCGRPAAARIPAE